MPANSPRQSGFSLIELVVGLVVAAIALTYLSVVFFANPSRSVDPLLQIRAAEFGQSLMDEILAKPYDELTPLGGVPPCSPCTPAANFGPEGAETRASYNDVDDYHSYCDSSEPYQAIEDAFGNLPTDFDNYQMSVCVVYDGDFDGTADNNENAKLITVDVYPPVVGGPRQAITIKAYRGNF